MRSQVPGSIHFISMGESRLREVEAAVQSYGQEERENEYIHPYCLIAFCSLIQWFKPRKWCYTLQAGSSHISKCIQKQFPYRHTSSQRNNPSLKLSIFYQVHNLTIKTNHHGRYKSNSKKYADFFLKKSVPQRIHHHLLLGLLICIFQEKKISTDTCFLASEGFRTKEYSSDRGNQNT